MNLHLGCGERYIDGWENIDWSDKYKVDYCLDLGKDALPFNDDSISRVISSHLIEHLDRWGGLYHLREIYRTMKPGGELILAFPDIKKIVDCFEGRDRTVSVSGNHKWLIEAIFETHKDETVIHKYGYTDITLKSLLEEIGFTNIQNIKNEIWINNQKVCDYRYAITILSASK